MDRDTTRATSAAGPEAATDRLRPPHPDDTAPADAFKDALRVLGEVREYVAYYVGAKVDGIKLSVRRVGILAALGVIGLLAAGAIVVTASVLLCVGLAQGIGVLLAGDYGPRVWLGNLIVGLVLLLLIGGGTWFAVSRLFNSSKRATVKKYELRRQRQRADFGHDVLQRAAERQPG